jgi:hypothetical protein
VLRRRSLLRDCDSEIAHMTEAIVDNEGLREDGKRELLEILEAVCLFSL